MSAASDKNHSVSLAPMKALSLYQPYASFVFSAGKHETRTWSTRYRGELLVCSTAKCNEKERARLTTDPSVYRYVEGRSLMTRDWFPAYPDGMALGLVELVDCVPASSWITNRVYLEETHEITRQRALGDIDGEHRFVWVLRNRRPLRSPIPVKGRQGLWTPAPELVEHVRAALAAGAVA